MKSREVIVFDMDGVLVDVTGSYREAIRQTVRRFTGQDVSDAHIQDLKNAGGWTNDWALSHRLIQEKGVSAAYEEVVAAFQEVFLGQNGDGLIRREVWVAQPGLLERLAKRYGLAVFTGRPRQEARITLGRFAQGIVFDPVIGAEDVDRGKPAPDGLLRIAEETAAARMWYVGDTVDDARSAKDAGVPFIGIAAPAAPRREELTGLFQELGAVAILGSINQLEETL